LRLGLRVVCWDVIAEDWRDDAAEVMLARIYRRLRRGSIVLFHDTLYTTTDERFRDRRPMRQAVETLLADLAGTYRFVTVPELLRLGRPVRWHWYQRSRLDWLKQVV
jgi:predicted O-methyltransferase YrrM